MKIVIWNDEVATLFTERSTVIKNAISYTFILPNFCSGLNIFQTLIILCLMVINQQEEAKGDY